MDVHGDSMTERDKQALLSALRAVEKLYFQNLALETLLDFYKVPAWRATRDELSSDTAIQPEVRARFRALYEELEHEPDLSAVQAFLLSLPTTGKPN
jgi:hypothetical protein